VERSAPLATALAPRIGYDRAASVVATAAEQGKTIREVARSQGLDEAEIARLLDTRRLTELP